MRSHFFFVASRPGFVEFLFTPGIFLPCDKLAVANSPAMACAVFDLPAVAFEGMDQRHNAVVARVERVCQSPYFHYCRSSRSPTPAGEL